MKTFLFWTLRAMIFGLECVLVLLLWLPIRLIWGANTLGYIFGPGYAEDKETFVTWMVDNLKH
jgi:hypothetical protein